MSKTFTFIWLRGDSKFICDEALWNICSLTLSAHRSGKHWCCLIWLNTGSSTPVFQDRVWHGSLKMTGCNSLHICSRKIWTNSQHMYLENTNSILSNWDDQFLAWVIASHEVSHIPLLECHCWLCGLLALSLLLMTKIITTLTWCLLFLFFAKTTYNSAAALLGWPGSGD